MCARGPRFVNLLGHVSFARRDSDDELFYTCLEYAPRCGRRRRRDEGRNLCRARVQDDPDGSHDMVDPPRLSDSVVLDGVPEEEQLALALAISMGRARGEGDDGDEDDAQLARVLRQSAQECQDLQDRLQHLF